MRHKLLPQALVTLFALGILASISSDSAAQTKLDIKRITTPLSQVKQALDGEFDLEPEVKLGKVLFHRDWSDHTQAKPREGADGLGPLYNAVSCVACHGQGGSGGGGDNSHNVLLLTRTTTEVKQDSTIPVTSKELTDTWHPGLINTSSIVLHRFSVNKSYEGAFKLWSNWDPVMILGKLTKPEVLNLSPTAFDALPRLDEEHAHALAIMRTERNTPSLFGLGHMDDIPSRVLERLSETQNKRFPEISGRVAPNGGKFGWRGQTSSVKNFVLGACANELGLQTPNFPQPVDPLADSNQPSKNPHVDLSLEEVNALVSYVDQLPPPEQIRPQGDEAKARWEEGRSYFFSARCDACHVRQIGAVDGLYTDLLLHDMGEKLNDPAALASTAPTSFQYYGTGDSFIVSDERKQEWRTPPLWGVRDSAPYLHDGSARTLGDAILAHGGEAETSRKLYEALRPVEQRRLVHFLHSLGSENGRRYVAR